MRSIAVAVGIFCALVGGAVSAQARPHPYGYYQRSPVRCQMFEYCNTWQIKFKFPMGMTRIRDLAYSVGRRPKAWCGWFMQRETGITSRGTGLNLNRAREWARVGRPSYPHVGAIVVWARGRHGGGHVGRIVGGRPGAWVVRSGNDGHRVRERVRSVSNAIAIRAL